MIKKLLTCLLSFTLCIASSAAIFADENVNELTIDESNGYITKIQYDGDAVVSKYSPLS